MAQDNTVSFKVFLRNDGVNEVRRFGVDRDVVSNFSYLREKLQAVFPSLRGCDFTVAWRDSDGDEIVISSDDELIIALTELQTEVRKLYVTVQAGSAMQYEQLGEGGHEHAGVICDGCEKKVEGFRYKCIQCPDYDLCAACENKSLHAEHYMIRIPVPTFWRPHFGKRLAHHLAKAVHKSGRCSGWESEAGHGPGRHHGGRHHGGRHGGGAGWLETLAAYLNEWTNLPGEEEPQDKKDTADPSSSKKQKPQEQQEDVRVQYLRNIGQTVASVLDPLGIDVDIEVRTRNRSEKRGDPEKEHDNKGGKNVPEEQTDAMEVDNKHEKEANASAGRSERESPETEGWTVVNEDTQKQSNITPNPSAGTSGVPAAETGAVPKQPITTYASTAHHNSVSSSSSNMYPNIFPLPGHVPLQPAQAPLPLHPPHMPVHSNPVFNPAPVQAFMQHPPIRPHIAEAVDKMMSMGFSNEGGWLTQLLESKNGNIEKALDVLQPVKKP